MKTNVQTAPLVARLTCIRINRTLSIYSCNAQTNDLAHPRSGFADSRLVNAERLSELLGDVRLHH